MDSLKKIPHSLSISSRGEDTESGKSVSRQQLINRLNFLNFQDRTVVVNLKHATFDNTISLQAKPLPCTGARLDCVWAEHVDIERILGAYRFTNLLVADGKKILLVEAEVTGLDNRGITLLLPEHSREICSRKARRHLCKGIEAHLIQNGAEFRGSLCDFTAVSFRIELTSAPPGTFRWIDAELPVHLRFLDDQEILFSGECRITRQRTDDTSGTFVLEPVHHQVHRFKPKEHRSLRRQLVPSPHLDFVHPLTKKPLSLGIIDLSGSGFSVEERAEDSVLLPGMILPRARISVADGFTLGCSAQVVYRRGGAGENGRAQVRCGLALLDMDPADHLRLVALLNQAADGNSYICNRVDMDALWKFFFESGFVSPEKYAWFQEGKEEIKRTFDRLYSRQSGIARHFTYQDGGEILGHMAMVRMYENAWLIHHHAASKSGSLKAGLIVLDQISRYVNDLHHLRSAHLDYVFCYYRPDNHFPNRMFGEFARGLDNPRGCSLDTFAYFHQPRSRKEEPVLAPPWDLADADPFDLEELRGFYGLQSGGLMLDAFAPRTGGDGADGLARLYLEQGFKSESHLFALKKEGVLQAVLLANISDVGLNMSNLTNCTTVMVLDETLPRPILRMALAEVAARYDGGGMPVLLYPVSYADRESLSREKLYTLWVLNLQCLDQYFTYCDGIFRHVRRS